jgi:hypothetical protein
MISGFSSLPLGAVRQSDTIFWSCRSHRRFPRGPTMPEVRSTYFTVPAFSAMIGSV